MVQLTTLSIPTRVEVELGCDNDESASQVALLAGSYSGLELAAAVGTYNSGKLQVIQVSVSTIRLQDS